MVIQIYIHFLFLYHPKNLPAYIVLIICIFKCFNLHSTETDDDYL